MQSTFRKRDDLVIPVVGFLDATEAITLQKFDAVVASASVHGPEISEFAQSLRNLNARSSVKTALFQIETPSTQKVPTTDGCLCDGYLPDGFGPESLGRALQSLSSAVCKAKSSSLAKDAISELASFEMEEFEEQVGGDPEFMAEIIALYFSERQHQVKEMHDALAQAEYDVLSRLAHTIKGSFGSLHATRARARAQELESAAKAHDAETCRQALAALEADLQVLEPQLLDLRDSLVTS